MYKVFRLVFIPTMKVDIYEVATVSTEQSALKLISLLYRYSVNDDGMDVCYRYSKIN